MQKVLSGMLVVLLVVVFFLAIARKVSWIVFWVTVGSCYLFIQLQQRINRTS